MKTTRQLGGALAAMLLAVTLAPGARAGDATGGPVRDPLVEPLIAPRMYLQMALSPDGKHLAAIETNGEWTTCVIIDLATQSHVLFAGARGRRDSELKQFNAPYELRWLNDERVAVNFRNAHAQAFDLQGKPVMDLGWRVAFQGRENGKQSDRVLVWRDSAADSLSRIDVRTGETQRINLDAPGELLRFTADSRGDVRMIKTISAAGWTPASRISQWYRASESSPWIKLDEYSVRDPDWTPLILSAGTNDAIVLANNGLDTMALWHYDPVKRAFGELMAAHDTDDIVGVRADDQLEEPRSVYLHGLMPQTLWLDASVGALQAVIDAARPAHVNLLSPSDSDRTLVFSYSDRDPGRWFVYDAKTKRLVEVGAARPAVDPERMSPMQPMRYKAADGVTVPAYLTLPGTTKAPAQPLPTVVLIHGGPQARDTWGWDAEVQALAARGYAVLQPQFRGSTGFGRKFELAGYGQWGLAMQDDITAGVRDLVARGIADPARLCIIGSEYGGYAALWGVAKDPGLYKCAVSFEGTSDLSRMVTDDSAAKATPRGREWILTHVGDWETMKPVFDSVSPAQHADRITAPVLLVHRWDGGNLRQQHSLRMRDALEREHKDVQLLQFPVEQSRAQLDDTWRVYYAALFALLERTIGKGTPPFAPAPGTSSPLLSSTAPVVSGAASTGVR